jgi:hypothetical protein
MNDHNFDQLAAKVKDCTGIERSPMPTALPPEQQETRPPDGRATGPGTENAEDIAAGPDQDPFRSL